MAILTFILGQSGTGKSRSIKNLPKDETALICVENKPLPFRGGEEFKRIVTDNAQKIVEILPKIKSEIIVIDDFQYIMANAYMRRRNEKGYDKFNDIGGGAYDIVQTINDMPAPNKRVYILSHIQEVDGRESIKTVGKMVDEKVVLEGKSSIVLKTVVCDGQYYFSTQNNGSDTVKSPEEMFPTQLIPNDLLFVDNAICDFYKIKKEGEK